MIRVTPGEDSPLAAGLFLGSVGRILNSEWIGICFVRSRGRIYEFRYFKTEGFDGHPCFMNEGPPPLPLSEKKSTNCLTPNPISQPIRKWQQQKWQKYDSGDQFVSCVFRCGEVPLSWFFSNQSFPITLIEPHGPCHSLSLGNRLLNTLWLGYSCVGWAGWIGWIDSLRPGRFLMLLLLDPRKLLNARESLNHRHTSVCSPWYPPIFGNLPWYVRDAFWVEV